MSQHKTEEDNVKQILKLQLFLLICYLFRCSLLHLILIQIKKLLNQKQLDYL